MRLTPWLNRIHRADCLELMPSLPAGSVDCVLTDLPYGITCNGWDSELPLGKLWAQWERLLKPGGCAVLTAMGPFAVRLCASKISWFRYKWVWVKDQKVNCLNASKMPMRSHEDVCVFYKNPPTYNPQKTPAPATRRRASPPQKKISSYGVGTFGAQARPGETFPADVLFFGSASSEGRVWHPTQKPLALGRYMVRTYTNPGDVVLDCACGAGTFPLAAMLEGRNFIGIEIGGGDPRLSGFGYADYREVAAERVRAALMEMPRVDRLALAQAGLVIGE